jgi:GTPase SAR1 family protein
MQQLTHGVPDGGDLALYDPTGPDQDPTQFSCGGYRFYLQYTTILAPEFYAYAEVQPFDSFGVILAYDPQSRESWEQVSHIHQRFQRRFAKRESLPFQVLVLGLKADVEDGQRQVTREEGEHFSTLHAYRFAECSARSGAGVREVFELFVLDAYNATTTPGRSPAAETRNSIRTAAAALNDAAPVLVQNNDSGTGRNRD